jgi:hypothetical protein
MHQHDGVRPPALGGSGAEFALFFRSQIVALVRAHGDRVLFLGAADVHAFRFIQAVERLDDEFLAVIESASFNAREIGAGCKDAAFVERLNKIGVDPVCGTPGDFASAIREDINIWKEAVQAAGMK